METTSNPICLGVARNCKFPWFLAQGWGAFGFSGVGAEGLGLGKAVFRETSMNPANVPNLNAKSYPMLKMHLPMQPESNFCGSLILCPQRCTPKQTQDFILQPSKLLSIVLAHTHARTCTHSYLPTYLPTYLPSPIDSSTRTCTYSFLNYPSPTPQNLALHRQESSTRAGGQNSSPSMSPEASLEDTRKTSTPEAPIPNTQPYTCPNPKSS